MFHGWLTLIDTNYLDSWNYLAKQDIQSDIDLEGIKFPDIHNWFLASYLTNIVFI